MPKFTKKPVTIEAFQVPPAGDEQTRETPHWLLSAVIDGTVFMVKGGGAEIRTLEGTMRANVGDWIIKGVKGELYPCKPDIFEDTYDPAQTDQS